MDPIEIHGQGVEDRIQHDIIQMLTLRNWICMPTHGNMYQRGFPDVYAVHNEHGQRWIEVKNPRKFSFTPAQRKYFPIILASGVGIWILTGATDLEYNKLFMPANAVLFLNGLVPTEITHKSRGLYETALERTLAKGTHK